jgi:cytochrome c-type biogenesis protein CcmF
MALASLVLGVGIPLVVFDALPWQALAGLTLAVWVLVTHVVDLVARARLGLGRVPVAYWGMWLGHIGFVVTVFGIALTAVLSVEKDLRMAPGQTESVAGLTITFDGIIGREGPNFVADRGLFVVEEQGRRYTLHPEKRRYAARDMVMTEAAIDAGFLRDVYVSLGEPVGDGAWAVRLQVKPFVRWIWFGAIVMMVGGVIAIADRRYKRLRAAAPAAVAGARA